MPRRTGRGHDPLDPVSGPVPAPALQLIADQLWDRATCDLLYFKRICHSSGYEVGPRDRRQTDKLNTRGESVRNGTPDSNRQASLTRTPGTDQAQQADVWP